MKTIVGLVGVSTEDPLSTEDRCLIANSRGNIANYPQLFMCHQNNEHADLSSASTDLNSILAEIIRPSHRLT
jgi:hypothetical protein